MLGYYDHNQKRYFERTHPLLDLDVLREFVSRLPSGGRVLDAGCGTGRDLRFFNRMGFQAEGMDVSPKMVELAREQSGCRVLEADIRLARLEKESYDGIWAHRLMIHFSANECQRVMTSFFMALKPQGLLLISIEEGQGEVDDRTDDPLGPARRIYRYQADDFASLIRQSGFRVIAQGRSARFSGRLAFIASRI